MISKELLSEVLKIEIIEILGIDNKSDLVYRIMQEYRCESGYESKPVGTFINIYELAHKCKEWAFKRKTNMLLTEFCINNDNLRDYHDKVDCRINIGYYNKKMEHCRATFTDKIELKAIFKACQWILDDKES